METKFTKGKWNIVYTPKYFNPECSNIEIHYTESDRWICKVQTNGVINGKEGIANAKLIAAAPEIIVNIDESIEVLEEIELMYGHILPTDIKVRIKQQIEKNKLVLKKATE